MISLTDFVSKWNGKGIDFDGYAGFQCQDLFRQYVQEVLGFPQSPGVVGAKDNWDVYLQDYYDRISNTPDGFPLPGDIMIWGAKYGPYGHVAVVISANSSSFTCLSQNDPAGSLCVIKKYTAWSALLGWLHPKVKSSIYRGYDLNNSDSMKIAVDKLVDIMEGKYISTEDHQKVINELDSKSTESANLYGKEKSILEEKIRTLEEVIKSLQDTEHSWADTADVLQRKLVAILAEFQSVGVSLSIEMDENVLVNSISLHLASITKLESDLKLANVSLLNTSKTVTDLGNVIVDLRSQIKSKDTSFRTVNLGSIIIKFYKK